ncbi:hypothetical protein M0657_008047 [Pyricularia oryzae]|uniref:Uncharacterized protein n=1 Tax=Pyricularia oryzae TaxID=318829 RepID=A0A4P7NA37_PYROR|nr:hypothetical protein M0657_008047 [Pyricularia oryzae]KAI7918931.1 hypothetical protein M9X92_006632 [Pyricularia oryzae]QBZ59409.1 hypothetical protein PoMZ_04370 [Pyricularia oryzae]
MHASYLSSLKRQKLSGKPLQRIADHRLASIMPARPTPNSLVSSVSKYSSST